MVHRIPAPALALALGLALSAVPSAAEDGASLGGTVKDESGLALPGATVSALNTATGRETVVVTGEGGSYEIRGLIPGRYRLTVRLKGFSASGRSLDLAAAQAQTQDFVLSLGALSEEITVTAAKGERATAEVPQMVTVVSSDQIERRRPGGVQEAFERAPNMRTVDTNPYRARPQFRGFSNARVLLIVDGERLNNGRYDVVASGVTPSTIDVTQIQSIEVVGGASSSLYGSDAIAGTINIITKTADRPLSGEALSLGATVDFNSNSKFARGNFAATYATPKFALRGAFSGFDQPDFGSGGERIAQEDVVSIGRYMSQVGASVGRAIASTWVVYDLADGAEVPNAGANGYTFNFDASFFPSEKHMFRARYLQNRFEDLGLPFSIPPYDTFHRLSDFADFDKVSGRYEARELASWLPRVAVSGYWQRLERPQHDIQYAIVQGSSYVGNTLTGNPSQFVLGSDTTTLNDIASQGLDVQLNFLPVRQVQFTTGLGYLKDESRDTFSRTAYSPAGAVLTSVRDVTTTPDTDYKNLGWYNQLEWTLGRYARVSGGFRVDNWKTEAKPTAGFPSGNEFRIIQAALPQIVANPGPISISGIQGIEELVAGTGSLETDVTTTTGNAGITFLLPGGINPFFRYATSFREPEITVRYLVRNFGPPTLSIPSLPNTEVEPEKGKNIDTGLKVDRERVKAQIGYFHNRLTGAVQNVFSPNYCIAAAPSFGLLPTPFPPCVIGGRHAVQFFQRLNVPGDVTVQGFEAAGEGAIALGGRGSLNPFFSVGWQKGTLGSPNATQLQLLNNYYNRSDTPVLLEGSVDDFPYSELPDWSGTFALKYTSARGNWWAEYEWRWASQITRVDPDAVFTVNTTLYGYVKSLEGYSKHSLRGGVSFGRTVPIRITVGIENLTNSTYFLPFQNAPAPGLAVVLGATVGWNRAF
jgi:outer membrane receptor protein involved in Fe transport